MGSDDSTGKNKIGENKARNNGLTIFLVVGICLGVVLAERLYVSRQRQTALGGTASMKLSLGSSSVLSAAVVDDSADDRDEVTIVRTGDFSKPARNDLETLLRKIAPTMEVLLAVSNKNLLWGGMLETYTNGFKQTGLSNHLVLALDEETKKWCEEHGINTYLMSLEVHKAQKGTGDNHAVSAMKFGIIKQFIILGWAVLLSDVDIAILQNPFDNLFRDSDVEGMTDGFDDGTAYGAIDGIDDASMGWARYAQYYKHFNMNSGLFYVKSNKRTVDLMGRLEDRLSKTKYWDQTAYNEEIFFLSHGKYKSPGVSVRVMEIDKFMNSKRLFKDVRNRPKEQRPPMPVMVHVNYHPDKHERMQAVFKYYRDGDEHALESFPGGSEKGT